MTAFEAREKRGVGNGRDEMWRAAARRASRVVEAPEAVWQSRWAEEDMTEAATRTVEVCGAGLRCVRWKASRSAPRSKRPLLVECARMAAATAEIIESRCSVLVEALFWRAARAVCWKAADIRRRSMLSTTAGSTGTLRGLRAGGIAEKGGEGGGDERGGGGGKGGKGAADVIEGVGGVGRLVGIEGDEEVGEGRGGGGRGCGGR
ncbi:basic proline-rich protein [Gracilaria domingensis]|nr:basic proline-rich protein [Gracilaria domingensis]